MFETKWLDFRLREVRGEHKERKVVRRFDAEGAVSRRRQEDDGVRVVGTVRGKIAGRDSLSDGRRSGVDWDVQGV